MNRFLQMKHVSASGAAFKMALRRIVLRVGMVSIAIVSSSQAAILDYNLSPFTRIRTAVNFATPDGQGNLSDGHEVTYSDPLPLPNANLTVTATASIPGAFATGSVVHQTSLIADANHSNFAGALNSSVSVSRSDDQHDAGTEAESGLNLYFTIDEPIYFRLKVAMVYDFRSFVGGVALILFDSFIADFQSLPGYVSNGIVSGILQPGQYGLIAFSSQISPRGFTNCPALQYSSDSNVSVSLKLAPEPITTSFEYDIPYTFFPAVIAPGGAGSVGSKAQLIGGVAGAHRDVSVTFLAPIASTILASDVVVVHGTETDIFVLQLTYNEAAAIALFGSESEAILGWFDPADGQWKNAVLGNSSGTPTFVGDRAYDPLTDFLLGYYGVDTANNHVWAVLDHNSQFAATPEPTSAALLALGTLLLTTRRRRSA